MTHQDSQELKTYLEQQFGEVRERFTRVDGRLDGIDGRLDGIDIHLDRQDIDFNKTTMNLLLTIQHATKESRRYAARLFGILDRPPLDAEAALKPARPHRPRRPRSRSGRQVHVPGTMSASRPVVGASRDPPRGDRRV